tara:strand:+ start:11016 stop:11867 length:852 start_codon:yes stop_codon:yes gene_type:complete
MMPQEDFIDGDFFEGLFDFKILGWDCLEKIKAEKPKFIYADTNYVLDLFGFLNNNEDIDTPIVLISHNSDVTIESHEDDIRFYPSLKEDRFQSCKLPRQIKKWFSQNLNIKNDKVFKSLPIGLERRRWSGGEKHKFLESCLGVFSVNKKHLLYVNYNIQNNPEKRSKEINDIERVLDKRYFGPQKCDFPVYAIDIINSEYVLCPTGNGLDTHRAWEALYLGSYPIVEDNFCNRAIFDSLPALFIKDFESLTQEYLISNLEKMRKNKNKEKLSQEYYKKMFFGK